MGAKPQPFPLTGAREVRIPVGEGSLPANVVVPGEARSLVIFAHGSGSSRHSPRNRYIAGMLQAGGLGTVLIDLLTPEEEEIDRRTAEYRFDIPFLGARLTAIADWVVTQPLWSDVAVGYFGASTGAAAALVSAAKRPAVVGAVVSRGGRPDLAGDALKKVLAPTLFIVGSEDHAVLELNRGAMAQLPQSTERELKIVQGATHLFEEPGTLEQVAGLARGWFARYLLRP